MSDQGLDVGGSEVTVGGIISRTFSVVSKNLPMLLGITALFYLPTLVINYLQAEALASGNTDMIVYSGLGNLLSLILQYVLVAAITFAVYASLSGNKASFGETVSRGFRFALPVIGVSILSAIAIAVGFLLLIIPGLIAMVMLSVAIPALVAERAGIFESLSRSADLTKGHRWTIFGAFIVWIIIAVVVAMVAGAIVGVLTFGTGSYMVAVVFDWALSVLLGMVGAVLAPVMYFELRVAKEGLDLGQIASVFD